jgi:translation initiation factor IF-2
MPKKKIVKKTKKSTKKKKESIKKIKKEQKAKVAKEKTQKEVFLGEVNHYYDKIKVIAMKLLAPLKLGDKIRIVGGEKTDFTQKVDSMEKQHQKLKLAKKGDEIGIKVKEKVREGYKVYKVS